MTKNELQLGTESIPKLLVRYAVPAIIAMAVTSFYNIADRAFIGAIPDVGPLAIAGLGITMPVFTLIIAFGVLIAMGGATHLALKLGEGEKEEAEKILGNMFMLGILVSLGVTVIGLIFINPILIGFGASSETLYYAKAYIGIIFVGVVFNLTCFIMNTAIRVDGNPKLAAKIMIVGCVLNLILDPLFIFGFNLGIQGAAMATVLCQIILCIWIMSYFLRGKSNLRLLRKNLKLEGATVKAILTMGIAPFGLELAASMVHIILNIGLTSYGNDLSIGGMTIITSIIQIFMMPVYGISQGVQPIIGYNYGAKDYKRAKSALVWAIGTASTILTVGFILISSFPGFFIGFFSNDQELLQATLEGMKLYTLTLPLLGIPIIGYVYFQATGRAKYATWVSLLRQCIFFIPSIWILSKLLGLKGVWLAQPVADIAATIIVLICLVKTIKSEK